MLPQNTEAREAIDALAVTAVDIPHPYRVTLRRFAKAYVTEVLKRNRWNQCKTARSLGIHRNTMTRQMKSLGIVRPRMIAQRKPVKSAVLARLERTA